MSGNSAWLADHVASLLPKTVVSFLPQATAGACVGQSTWTSNRSTCSPTQCCDSTRTCHYSCHGLPICTGWHQYACF
jgi:hypothetical protein